MTHTLDARSSMLAAVRAANGRSSSHEDAAQRWVALPRRYTDSSVASSAATLERFIDRLRDYDALVYMASEAEASSAVASILHGTAQASVLAPSGFPKEFLPVSVSVSIDEGFTAAELDGFDTVITEATLGIAETGTLVLQSVPGQGRRAASLVPDTHICLLHGADVVATVPEAMRRLQATACLPTTFISGPSATADIEMTRIKGVHGPRTLHVILLQ